MNAPARRGRAGTVAPTPDSTPAASIAAVFLF